MLLLSIVWSLFTTVLPNLYAFWKRKRKKFACQFILVSFLFFALIFYILFFGLLAKQKDLGSKFMTCICTCLQIIGSVVFFFFFFFLHLAATLVTMLHFGLCQRVVAYIVMKGIPIIIQSVCWLFWTLCLSHIILECICCFTWMTCICVIFQLSKWSTRWLF